MKFESYYEDQWQVADDSTIEGGSFLDNRYVVKSISVEIF